MTRTAILRAHRKLWERVTRGDGYQPFGYDERTLRITKPGYIAARQRLKSISKEHETPVSTHEQSEC